MTLWGSFSYGEGSAFLRNGSLVSYSDYDVFVQFDSFDLPSFLRPRRLPHLWGELHNPEVQVVFTWEPLVRLGLQRFPEAGLHLRGRPRKLSPPRERYNLHLLHQVFNRLLGTHPLLEDQVPLRPDIRNYHLVMIVLNAMQFFYESRRRLRFTFEKRHVHDTIRREYALLFSPEELLLMRDAFHFKTQPERILGRLPFAWNDAFSLTERIFQLIHGVDFRDSTPARIRDSLFRRTRMKFLRASLPRPLRRLVDSGNDPFILERLMRIRDILNLLPRSPGEFRAEAKRLFQLKPGQSPSLG